MKIEDLDATGLLCPLPVLKLRKRLGPLDVGDCMRLRADDPAAVIDVPHFCAEAGHEFVSMSDEDGVQSYLIRRSETTL